MKEKTKTYIETKDNPNTMTQNLWDAMKVALRGEFIATNAYLNKQERYQIKNLLQHKELWGETN